MTTETKPNLDALIQEAESGPQKGPQSWYSTLDGDEKEFIDLLIGRAIETGTTPAPKPITRILKREFKDNVTTSTISRTFEREIERLTQESAS